MQDYNIINPITPVDTSVDITDSWQFWATTAISIFTLLWNIFQQIKIERLRHEHQIKFSELHKRRMAFILYLIKRFNLIGRKLNEFRDLNIQRENEKIIVEELIQLIEETGHKYNNYSVYLNSALSKKVVNLFNLFDEMMVSRMKVKGMPKDLAGFDPKSAQELLVKFQFLPAQINLVKKDLRSVFRKILGVT